jgi:hypothetical protein
LSDRAADERRVPSYRGKGRFPPGPSPFDMFKVN